MINLHDCRFGDRLVTEEGKMVVYLGYSKPIKTGPLEQEGYHVIAGEYGEVWFYISNYDDDGTVIYHNGKVPGAGSPLNITGIYKGDGIDLSKGQVWRQVKDKMRKTCRIPRL